MNLKHTISIDSFKDKVYLLESGHLFAVFMTETHYCLASVPTLDKALECLGNIIRRHETYSGLLIALKECETQMSPSTYTQRQFKYNEEGHKYEKLVNDVIEDYEHERLSKYKKKTKVIKKKKKVIKKRA